MTTFAPTTAAKTLGAVPSKLARRCPAMFIPWADVERIVLYPALRQG